LRSLFKRLWARSKFMFSMQAASGLFNEAYPAGGHRQ
jgi:hypothetical protein